MSDNTDKILAAKAVLEAYREGKPESAVEAIGDLIADLLHLAHHLGIEDVRVILNRAQGYFEEEGATSETREDGTVVWTGRHFGVPCPDGRCPRPGGKCLGSIEVGECSERCTFLRQPKKIVEYPSPFFNLMEQYLPREVTAPCGAPGKIGELQCTCASDGNPETEHTAVCDGCDHETWKRPMPVDPAALALIGKYPLKGPVCTTAEELAAVTGDPLPPMPILKHTGPLCSKYEVGKVCSGDTEFDCSECPNLIEKPKKHTFQFKVNFEFEAPDLKGAYRQLQEALRLVQVGWETDDQWWDENGEAHGEKELQEAILAVLEEEDRELHTCPKCGGGMELRLVSIDGVDELESEVCPECGHTRIPDSTLRCKFCNRCIPKGKDHLHQGGFVGECCWDDRLRQTE